MGQKNMVSALQKQHPHNSVGTDKGEAPNMPVRAVDFLFPPPLEPGTFSGSGTCNFGLGGWYCLCIIGRKR